MRATGAVVITAIALVCWAVLTAASGVIAPKIATAATEVQVALGLDVSRGERTR